MQLKKFYGAALGVVFLSAFASAAAHADSVRWSGDVDDEATIRISKSHVSSSANMKGIKKEHSDIHGSLPDHPVRVTLKSSGRGRVWLAEEPSPKNGFTAVIKIKDNAAASGHYEFTLDWDGGGPGPEHHGHRH